MWDSQETKWPTLWPSTLRMPSVYSPSTDSCPRYTQSPLTATLRHINWEGRTESHWGFPVTRIRCGRIRQDTAGYGRIRQDTAGYGRIRQDTAGYGRIRQDTAGYDRIRQDRQDTAGYGRIRRIRQIRQDTAGYGRIRQDTTGSRISACLHYENNHFAFIQRSVVFHTVLACLL